MTFSLCDQDFANALRILAMDSVEKAGSGHPGLPLGMADVMSVLGRHFLRFDARTPCWPNRDRFVLSAGHGSLLLYAFLYLAGYSSITLKDLQSFRQLHSPAAGHPEHMPGVETTTGPLGQGLGNAVGMALAQRHLNARFPGFFDYCTYVMVSDGCLMEGISHEVLSFAGHQKLGNLVVLFDDNGITIDGEAALSCSDNVLRRLESYGFHVQAINAHDTQEIDKALQAARAETIRPSFIACRSIIGYGAPHKQGSSQVHGAPLGKSEVAAAREKLGWSSQEPFDIPEPILKAWRDVGVRGSNEVLLWQEKVDALEPALKQDLRNFLAGELPEGWQERVRQQLKSWVATGPKDATRQMSKKVLDVLVQEIPMLVGGSADLASSTGAHPAGIEAMTPDHPQGRYIHYGIREHGMMAISNGLALCGLIPYHSTFLAFTDYARPALRLAALMGLRTLTIATHDSIGLGEDGPTHQPIEHLVSLRAMPQLNVFRPYDAAEVVECWIAALEEAAAPSVLVLSRQGLGCDAVVRKTLGQHSLCALGAYSVRDVPEHEVVLLSTGTEVALALQAGQYLQDTHGIGARVVSMPCWEIFEKQTAAYRKNLLDKLCFVIEAASPMGWERYVSDCNNIVALKTFGASAPGAQLYQTLGITVDRLVERVLIATGHGLGLTIKEKGAPDMG